VNGTGAWGGAVPPGYVLRRVVGRGASSVVWEATQLSTGRPVALKLLEVDLRDDDARGRFERERQAMAALSQHPHIVALYDAGVVDHSPWLALQLCARGSYAAALREHGPMPAADALDVLIRIGEALVAAHAQGVLHCDVKPANIMITDYGSPALTDFGVARGTVSARSQTVAGGYSLDHVAPEVLNNARPTVVSDVYSLATTVWELLCGRAPFRDDSDVGPAPMVARILRGPLPTPILPGVPPELTALLTRMAAVDPATRPQSMAEAVATARGLATPRPAGVHAGPAPAPTLIGPPATTLPPVSSPPGIGTAATNPPQPPSAADGNRSAPPPPADTGWTPQPAFAAPAPPPPGGSGTAPPRGTGPPADRPRRRWPLVAALVVVVALLAGGGVWWWLGSRSDGLVLHAASGPGTLGAFTSDFATTTGPPGSVTASSLPRGIANRDAVPGATDGLYRGVKGSASCDRDRLADFLGGRPDLATAWVSALRSDPGLRWSRSPTVLSSGDLATFVRELTPVLLRADTRVHEHGWSDGSAQDAQAVLQAGTAVLVDGYGVPRVRCASGNPLTAPEALRPGTTPPAGAWPGFDLGATVAVTGAGQNIREFGLTDPADAAFRRPAGSLGPDDVDAVPATASPEGAFVLKGPQTACDLSDCSKTPTLEVPVIISECTRSACTVRAPDGQWDGAVPLTAGTGGVWTATGALVSPYGYTCNDEQIAATFTLTLSARAATVVDTVWTASSVAGQIVHTIPATSCTAGRLTWNVSATR